MAKSRGGREVISRQLYRERERGRKKRGRACAVNKLENVVSQSLLTTFNMKRGEAGESRRRKTEMIQDVKCLGQNTYVVTSPLWSVSDKHMVQTYVCLPRSKSHWLEQGWLPGQRAKNRTVNVWQFACFASPCQTCCLKLDSTAWRTSHGPEMGKEMMCLENFCQAASSLQPLYLGICDIILKPLYMINKTMPWKQWNLSSMSLWKGPR